MVDTVFLTGGTGFVGGHVLDRVLSSGYAVKALKRPESARGILERDGVQVVEGDLTRAGALVPHLRDCRYVIHAAAVYSFAPSAREAIWATNVMGTRSLMEAARIAGVERVVVTSSSATVGPAPSGRPATEDDWGLEHRSGSAYHQSKIWQERQALAAQIPTVILLPTAPVGPGDRRPTPTGKMIVDFLRGGIFGTLPGGLNLVAVEDVADAHVAALTRGAANERYIIGGRNLTLPQVWELLAHLTGGQAPRLKVPYSLALLLGAADEMRCRLTGREPMVPLEGVRMGRELMFVASRRSEQELGYRPTSVTAALGRAVGWFRDHGYV